MDAGVELLAQHVVKAYGVLPPEKRLLVAVAGRPGSGKSTLAYPLADRINELILGHPTPHPAQINDGTAVAAPHAEAGRGDEIAICVGLDGWHFSRAELDQFPDPELAHWRRGAAFTFDLESYAKFVCALRQPLQPNPPAPIPFPTFDHTLKDPCPSPVAVRAQHRIVIIEGLYTLLSKPGWKETAQQMDMRVWVEVPRDVVLRRVLKRNTDAGIVTDPEVAVKRVNECDMANGDEVYENQYEPTETIYPTDNP